jgi:Holliday junction resolvasome RuvABC endonuclease subunit
MTMNKQIAYIGIDPGKGGAIALLTPDHYEVVDYPGDPAQVVDVLRSWLLRFDTQLAALEKVSARPGQGVVSMFTFGQNLGAYQGILAAMGIPYVMPTPQQWQRGLVDQKAGPDPKTRSLVTARRLFPNAELSRKKDHGRADALLMAHWARRNH